MCVWIDIENSSNRSYKTSMSTKSFNRYMNVVFLFFLILNTLSHRHVSLIFAVARHVWEGACVGWWGRGDSIGLAFFEIKKFQ